MTTVSQPQSHRPALPVATGTFGRHERLVSRTLIETLFGNGDSHSLAAFPLRAVYLSRPRPADGQPVQLLVSVSKRHFKHAVDRNRVKRQLREAYRRRRQLLMSAIGDDEQLLLALLWLSDSHCPSAEVDKRVANLLRRVAEKRSRS